MRVWSGEILLAVPLPIRCPSTGAGGAGSDWRFVVIEWESLQYDTLDNTGQYIERIAYADRFPL